MVHSKIVQDVNKCPTIDKEDFDFFDEDTNLNSEVKEWLNVINDEKNGNDYIADPLKKKQPNNVKPRAKQQKRPRPSKTKTAQQSSVTRKDDSVTIIIVVVSIFVSAFCVGYYIYVKKEEAREKVQVVPDPEKANNYDDQDEDEQKSIENQDQVETACPQDV